MLSQSVTAAQDVDAVATLGPSGVDVLMWNYHDDDLISPTAHVQLRVNGLPVNAVRVQQFRMDGEHGNAYTAWQRMGSPQRLSAAQKKTLQQRGQLDSAAPERVQVREGSAAIELSLPRQGVYLVHLQPVH